VALAPLEIIDLLIFILIIAGVMSTPEQKERSILTADQFGRDENPRGDHKAEG